MNYIKSLQQENSDLKAQLEALKNRITDQIVYLHSAKFCGDGNNFVNSDEQSTFLLELRMETLT